MAKMNTGQKIRRILPCSGVRQKDYGGAGVVYFVAATHSTFAEC